MLKTLLEEAGFINLEEKPVRGVVTYASADEYWLMMNEVAAPLVGILSRADEPTREKIREDIYKVCAANIDSSGVVFPFSTWIVRGEKRK